MASIATRARRTVKPPSPYGTEDALQADIVRALRLAVTRGVLVHHAVNEGTGDVRRGKRNKRMGVLAGWPDVELVGPDGRARFLEIKLPGGSLSAAQKARHAELRGCGCPVTVVRSVGEAMAQAAAWGLTHARPTTPGTKKGASAATARLPVSNPFKSETA